VLNWSKLCVLSSREKWLLVASLVALPLNGLALNVLGLNRWRGLLSLLSPVNQGGARALPESLLDQSHQTARVVGIASSRGPYRGNCLQRSLTIWWLLRRQKIESDIRFGARREDGKFEAHAWVEFRGFVLNEDPGIHHGFTAFEHGMTDAEAKIR
jgi:hypothetical protein